MFSVPPPIKDVSLKTCMYDIYKHLHPLPNDWDDQGILGKVFSVIKVSFSCIVFLQSLYRKLKLMTDL